MRKISAKLVLSLKKEYFRNMPLLEFSPNGIFCAQAGVYIDPWKPVQRALLTHGHSDHARPGHQFYLCTRAAQPVIRHRLGPVSLETLGYGEATWINGVRFSFHPAGHIVGSAQVRVEYRGEVWVVSGDYKLENDGISDVFEPVPCHTFITESTFGLPVFHWKPQERIFGEINAWWQENLIQDNISVITAYALGKAQRILTGLDLSIGPVFTHPGIENVMEVIRAQGISLPPTRRLDASLRRRDLSGGIILAPPAVAGSQWLRQWKPYSLAVASGWMAAKGNARRRNADRGFVLSDHADWAGLNEAVKATGARRVVVTHGYTELFSRWLESQGLEAASEKTAFEGESMDMAPPEAEVTE